MGQIAEECILRISDFYPDIIIDHYVIMPNHVHAIIYFKKEMASTTLSHVIGQYKMAVTKKIHDINSDIIVWQRSFHDHVIRGEQDYLRIWEYIDNNPARWAEDMYYEEGTP